MLLIADLRVVSINTTMAVRMLFLLLVATFYSSAQIGAQKLLAAVILSQPTNWHQNRVQHLKELFATKLEGALVLDTVNDFPDVVGGWAVWPLFSRIDQMLQAPEGESGWIFFCEDNTVVKPELLMQVLSRYDAAKPFLLGHALRDRWPTIIHHFAFSREDADKFLYPDFAAGMAFSLPMLKRMLHEMSHNNKPRDFSIDPKHELAMIIRKDGAGEQLTNVEEFCTTRTGDDCATEYPRDDYEKCNLNVVLDDDITFAVKTYHAFHKNRIVIVKRTWGSVARNIEYFSDEEDMYIPTTVLGVNNTERGHCGKTIRILQHYAKLHPDSMKWLVIADDDTLLSVSRLTKLLSCYDHRSTLIIGESYGFGFGIDGNRGYTYPTGGAGMIFSSPAVNRLAEQCQCPSVDSPDDMILGICAQTASIPIIHSATMHQARPDDYAEDYLKRLKPVSFHKHWEVDPYQVYNDWLSEEHKHSHRIEL